VKARRSDFEDLKSDVEWLYPLGIKFQKGRGAQYLRTQEAIADQIAQGNLAESVTSVTSSALLIPSRTASFNSAYQRRESSSFLIPPSWLPPKKRMTVHSGSGSACYQLG
jgi:hypothetical protein